MSMFSEANDDALSIRADQATVGPRLGFLGAYEAAYEAQTRASSVFAIEKHLRDAYEEQKTSALASGVSLPAWPGNDYALKLARNVVDGTEPELDDYAKSFEQQVDTFKKQRPDIVRTPRELFDEVRTRAQTAERRYNDAATTFGGDIGGFLGGAIASLDPRTDPLNFATLPAGGGGKTAAVRIASQVGAQGVIETLNQVTGVQEERRLLGLEHGFGQGALQVASSALGAGVLQGIGEGAVALGKRWFRDVPHDPAPPPPVRQDAAPARAPEPLAQGAEPVVPQRTAEDVRVQRVIDDPQEFARLMQERSPLGTSRPAQARTVLDVDNVTRALEDWNGPRPWEVGPRAAAAEVRGADGVQIKGLNETVERVSVDATARGIDPDTFRIYDRLAERKQQLQGWLNDLQEPRQAEAHKSVADLSDEISRLQERIAVSNRKNAKKYEARIEELRAERDAIVQDMTTRDTPDMALVRKELVTTDEQMRDLAPVVSRAYAHARDAWALGAQDREAVRQMIRQGDKTLPERAPDFSISVDEPAHPATPAPPTLTEKVPMLATRPDIVDAMPGADAADVVSKIVAENAKVLDATVEGIIADVDRMMKGAVDNKLTLEGYEYKLDLNDRITIPNDDGSAREVSVREYLEDLKRDNDELQSVATCSIKPRS